MAKHIQLFDFCKNGVKKAAKSYDLGTPLDTVETVGLNSLSCNPLIAHRSTVGNAIFSQFKQANGIPVKTLLTTPSDTGITGGLQQCLAYGANIAGLRGASPLTGTATDPFPVNEPGRQLLWSVGGAGFAQVVNGTPQSLAADPTAFDRTSGNSMLGFGGILTGSSGGGTLVQLPPDSREYEGGVRLRGNHTYVPYLKLPYVPSLQSLLFAYNATFGYYIIPGGVDITGTNGTCTVEGHAAPVCPCLLVQNGDLGVAGANEPNGASLTRQYNFFRLNAFTLPGFNGSYAGTYDVLKSDCRAFMCIYVNSSRVDNVSCHEGAGGAASVTLPIPGNGPPSAFDPIFPGLNFDTVYQFAVTGNEPTYTFDVTYGATTITTTPTPFFSGGGTHIRAFEGFIDMYKSADPTLPC